MKKCILVIVLMFACIMPFSGTTNANSQLLKPGPDSPADSIEESKKAEWVTILENQFNKNGVNLVINKYEMHMKFSDYIVVIFDVFTNNDPGKLLMPVDRNGFASTILHFEASDMEKYARFIQMDEYGKKQYLKKIFLQYAKLDLGPIEEEPTL
jgi:hypothetical protein